MATLVVSRGAVPVAIAIETSIAVTSTAARAGTVVVRRVDLEGEVCMR